jgi:6-hydroxytryprostatin B O-methyltransferase
LVDIGGHTGELVIALAQVYPEMRFMVEDLPDIVAKGEKTIPENLSPRIQFVAHDFFQPQPAQVMDTAAAFLMRHVLHDHPDARAKDILKSILPGLKRGARLLVVDQVLPPVGTLSPSLEKVMRIMDLGMMTYVNSKERELGDWKELFAAVDERLEIVGLFQRLGSAGSIMDVRMK